MPGTISGIEHTHTDTQTHRHTDTHTHINTESLLKKICYRKDPKSAMLLFGEVL